jgi:hypothetical protein
VARTFEPVCVAVELHAWVTVSPFAKTHSRAQPLSAFEVVTFVATVAPPFHVLVARNSA